MLKHASSFVFFLSKLKYKSNLPKNGERSAFITLTFYNKNLRLSRFHNYHDRFSYNETKGYAVFYENRTTIAAFLTKKVHLVGAYRILVGAIHESPVKSEC